MTEKLVRTFFLLFCVLIFAGCSAAVDDERVNIILDIDADVEAGLEGYTNECERCHGPNGNGDGNIIGPPIENNAFSRQEIIEFMLKGPKGMPVYSDKTDQVLADVAAYVDSL